MRACGPRPEGPYHQDERDDAACGCVLLACAALGLGVVAYYEALPCLIDGLGAALGWLLCTSMRLFCVG